MHRNKKYSIFVGQKGKALTLAVLGHLYYVHEKSAAPLECEFQLKMGQTEIRSEKYLSSSEQIRSGNF